MDRIDWNLLVVSSAGGAELSPVQLQKALFIIGDAVPGVSEGDFYAFEPYNYGPFSKAIYADVKLLAEQGLVEVSSSPERGWSCYRATPEGLEKARELSAAMDVSISTYVEKIVEWIRNLTFEQLLAYLYSHYPDYAKNSIFKARE